MNAPLRATIVDYGLGNLFSVAQACHTVGFVAEITHDRAAIASADLVVLPGVGAFGDAMDSLQRKDLVGVLRDVAAAGRPLAGVCLGIQLLMSESCEFGSHAGLGIVPGRVVPLEARRPDGQRLKIPHISWSRVRESRPGAWTGTALSKCHDGDYMYFVHSFVVEPDDPAVTLATTQYGDAVFCSSLARGNVFACQFHPERSGHQGLVVYKECYRIAADARLVREE